MNTAIPDPSCFEDKSAATKKKPYETPQLIELGNVVDLTNYSVSVHVSSVKNSGESQRSHGQNSGDSYEA